MFSQEKFGARLRILRFKSGCTQADIARTLKMERSSYTYYETGGVSPSFASLVYLSKYYGVTTDWLLMGKASNDFERELTAELEERDYYSREFKREKYI